MGSTPEITESSAWLALLERLPQIEPSAIQVDSGMREEEFIPASKAAPSAIWNWLIGLGIVVGFLVAIFLVTRNSMFRPIWISAETDHWARLVFYPAFLWAIMGTILLAFRTLLWIMYRPFPAAAPEEAPDLTVIIPAYNEGPMVAKSIDSVAASHYPAGRLEILVVDDGSKDDTWKHIQIAAARHPNLVTAIQFSKNRGKREALAAGFEKARGEIVVTLDSDSVIERHTLIEAAGPFRDGRIAAVAGRVGVYNRREGMIPRMLHVRYILSFDLIRAAESAFRTVYCCPGAITAYRVSVVRKVLDAWKHQTFLGSKCTYGEDRALTNYIFKEGYDAVYQGSAVAHTVVPTTYSKLCKMFIRWNRSYVREEIRFLGIVWKRPLSSRVFALADRLITNIRYPVYYSSLAMLFILIAHQPSLAIRFLTVVGITAFFNTMFYLRSERSPDFFYGVLYSYYSLVGLTWIFPYAFLTVRARSWLTR
jgi:hyaluronan synthase